MVFLNEEKNLFYSSILQIISALMKENDKISSIYLGTRRVEILCRKLIIGKKCGNIQGLSRIKHQN